MMGPGDSGWILTEMGKIGIDLGHIFTGTDVLNVAVTADQLPIGNRNELQKILLQRIDAVSFRDDVAVVRVIGPGMKGVVGTSTRVSSSLSDNGINDICHTQPDDESSMTYCVAEKDGPEATRAMYDAVVRPHTH